MAELSEGLDWQTSVWNRMADVYIREVDRRFEPVVGHCVDKARIRSGEVVLDLGTGTGSVALAAGEAVGPDGSVVAVDLSPEMLTITEKRVAAAGLRNLVVREGKAEEIPADDDEFDVLVASLSLMYAVDRSAAATECARVLRPDGRFVAAVWAGPDKADIVRFQQTAGSFAPPPPVPGVGPGALADSSPFVAQLRSAGIDCDVISETTKFAFDNFDQAWEVLAGVTTANLEPDRREAAKAAVQAAMWPDPHTPRVFSNQTQFIIGQRTNRPRTAS